MSDEEEYEDEEVEEEEEVEEDAVGEEPPAAAPPAAQEERRASKISTKDEDQAPQEERKLRAPPPREEPTEEKEMTEAEAAVAEARKRKEEADAHKLLDYEQQRKIEKETIEQELRELREKQQRRRAERDQEQREYAERMKQDEERRRQEEDAHKQQNEEAKRKRDEEKHKRQQMIAGSLLGAVGGGEGANYVVQKGSGGLPGQGEGEGKSKKRGPSAEQIAAAKKQYIESISRKPNISDILPNDLKTLIKRLHTRIDRIIGETYDLQQRSGRQEYDLNELHDRQQNAQRNKALSMGIDPTEAGDLKHPPKVHVASKFDRQTDRRSYVDKKDLFEKPYVAPTPKIAHGTARPPTEWGRKKGTGLMDEIEQIRKNLEPPKYVEQAPIEGAKPPVAPIPLNIPDEEYESEPPAGKKQSVVEEPQEVEAEA